MNLHKSIGAYVFVAAILFASELIFGIGVIGVPLGLSVAVAQVLLSRKSVAPHRNLQISGIFLCLAIATFTWLTFNVHIGKRNAGPVVDACERFRQKNSRYPGSLNELVPEFIPSIPAARYTVLARRYAYGQEPPALCFAAMFHGVFCYDFHKRVWITNE